MDILGKYVAKFMRVPHPETLANITPEFLAEHGFV
jgi:hypothetical protein